MFMLPRSIYDEWPKWWTMTDSPLNGSRTRNAGAMEPLYWSPGSPIFEMTSEDALKLPRFAIEICRVPHLAGRDLVSEHPASATSWRIKGAVRASSRRPFLTRFAATIKRFDAASWRSLRGRGPTRSLIGHARTLLHVTSASPIPVRTVRVSAPH